MYYLVLRGNVHGHYLLIMGTRKIDMRIIDYDDKLNEVVVLTKVNCESCSLIK